MPMPFGIPKQSPSFLTRTSQKPSPYPAFYHVLHFAQLLSALVVSAVLSYFIQHLHDEDIPIPWTFSLLLTTSILTILHLIFSIYVDLTRTVNPAIHLIQNTALTVCWIVSLGLLLNNISWTLGHRCVVSRWHNEAGVMICRMYKALAAFAVCGAIATGSALALDVSVRQKLRSLGVYDTVGGGSGSGGLQMKSPVIKIGEGNSEGVELHGVRDEWGRRDYETEGYQVQRPIGTKQFGKGPVYEEIGYEGHKLQ